MFSLNLFRKRTSRRERRAQAGPLVIFAPVLPPVPPEFLAAFARSDTPLSLEPLSGAADFAGRASDRQAIIRAALGPHLQSRSGAVIVAAGGLMALPRLREWLPELADLRLAQLDWADLLRAVIHPLRAEMWQRADGPDAPPRSFPIPDAAEFRPVLDTARIANQVHMIQTARAGLAAALEGLDVRQIICDRPLSPEDARYLGIAPYDPAPPAPIARLAENADAILALARDEQIPTADLPQTAPAIMRQTGPRLLAVLAGRNIAPYLPVLAGRIRDEGIRIAYIDNASDDDSAALARAHFGAALASVDHLPFDGSFALRPQLEAKEKIIARLAPEWVIHLDADEIIEHREPGQTLLDLADEAEAGGYNALNFEEFVFLPEPGESYAGRDYLREMRRYYFYQPRPYRLVRMWRAGQGLSNIARSGHALGGPLRLAPQSHNLRHYIVLDEAAARAKYISRVYAAGEIAQNWHRNRLGIEPGGLAMPPLDDPRLLSLDAPASRALRRDVAQGDHWWKWPPLERV